MPAQRLWLLVTGVQEVNGALQGAGEVPEEQPGPLAADTKLNVPACFQ